MLPKNISEKRINELKSRSKRCVCKYCGGKLKVRLLDFGDIETANLEIFCENCDMIEYGVEPQIYRNAVYFVDNLGFNAYQDRQDADSSRRLSIGKVCEIISWHERQIGILDENGYKVELNDNNELLDCADGSIIVVGEKITEE